jgi:hypothetical protein
MKVRAIEERDISALKSIHEARGWNFPFPDVNSSEAAQVVVDDEDRPIMAATAKRIAEVVLICPENGNIHPLVKMEAIKMLHESIRDILVPKGITEVNAFLPPEIEKSHGRHLVKWFGWAKNWPSFTIRDWKVPNG